jgi:H/ACA ribonucleoprotein complex subunit 2
MLFYLSASLASNFGSQGCPLCFSYVSATAAAVKSLRRGVKEVVKAIRKGEKGSVLFAGSDRCLLLLAREHLPHSFPLDLCSLSVCSIMLIAANITPIDVVSHLPVLCEEQKIPYIYVPSKEELGVAGATKRPTSCILVQLKKDNEELKEAFEEVAAEIKKVAVPVE